MVGTIVFGAVATVTIAIMHGSLYAASTIRPIAVVGAIADVLLTVSAGVAAALLYRVGPRGRWLVVAALAVGVALFFAVLAPATAGYGWLSVFLFGLASIVYVLYMVAFVLFNRPWRWLPARASGSG